MDAIADGMFATPGRPRAQYSSNISLNDSSTPMSSNKRQKTMRTYGSSGQRSQTSAHDQARNREALYGDEIRHPSDRNWSLPPTLRNDFVRHNPESMFSEPSSTIPDNTMSQQRIIQEALQANAQTLNEEKSVLAPESESSIPWSVSLETQQKSPVPSNSHVLHTASAQSTQSRCTQKQRSKTVSMNMRSSQTSRRSSQIPDTAPMAESSPLVSKASAKDHQIRGISQRPSGPKITASAVQMLSEIEVHDEPAVDIVQDVPESVRAKRDNTSPKKPEPTAQLIREALGSREIVKSTGATRSKTMPRESGQSSDELWVGLPKEQYKPRPSRRRSNQVTDLEYALAVQQTLLPRSKRRKTMHGTHTIRLEEVAMLVSIGFSPKKSRLALEQTAGNTEKAIDVLTAQVQNEKENQDMTYKDDCSKGATDIVKISRFNLVEVAISPPKLIATKLTGNRETKTFAVDLGQTPLSLPQVPEVVLATYEGRPNRSKTDAVPTRSQKPRRVLDSESPGPDISPIKAIRSLPDKPFHEVLAEPDELESGPPAPAEKKRGRGRPRKSDTAVAAAPPAVEAPAKTQMTIAYDGTLGDSEEGFVPAETAVAAPDNHSSCSPAFRELGSVSSANRSPPLSTPEQQATSNLKTPQKEEVKISATTHSPISKAKVPHRVGLSRRTRIAPLLRMIKK